MDHSDIVIVCILDCYMEEKNNEKGWGISHVGYLFGIFWDNLRVIFLGVVDHSLEIVGVISWVFDAG